MPVLPNLYDFVKYQNGSWYDNTWKTLLIQKPSRVKDTEGSNQECVVILEAYLDHRNEDWTLSVNSEHNLKPPIHMTLDLFLSLLETLFIHVF